MSLEFLVGAIAMIVSFMLVVGFPSLAIVAVRFFKLKERELTLELEYRQLELEYRQKTQQQNVAIEQRVQRLEDVLTSLDQDVRVRLGIHQVETPLASRPDLVEGPASTDPQRGTPLDPSRTKAQ
jgi:hypothetical protein